MDCGPPFFPSLPSLSPCPVRSAAISHLICLLHVYRDTHTHTPKISSLFFLICFCHCPCVFFFSSPSHPLIVYVFHTKCLATARQVHCFIHPQRSSVLDSKYRTPREKKQQQQQQGLTSQTLPRSSFHLFPFSKISLLFLNPNTEPTLFENEMKREREKNPFTGIPNSPIVAPMNRQVTHNTTQYSILKYSLSQPLTQVAHTLTHARSTGYTVKKNQTI